MSAQNEFRFEFIKTVDFESMVIVCSKYVWDGTFKWGKKK